MQPQTAQHVADGGTWITYILVVIGGAFAWFDTHSAGLIAMAALVTAAVNWWYRRVANANKWDGKTERRNGQDV